MNKEEAARRDLTFVREALERINCYIEKFDVYFADFIERHHVASEYFTNGDAKLVLARLVAFRDLMEETLPK